MQPETANVNIDETMLIKLCRRGDSAAMERLILKYQNRIYNTVLKMCANIDDAAELTQDVFVKVIESIDKFDGRSSFYTWLFRIAVNLTLNYCKRAVRLGTRSIDADDEHGPEAKGLLKEILHDNKLPEPAVIAQNKELCDVVARSLLKLDETHRAVIILRDIEGMNYAQIAQVLDLEMGTVKSRLSRARNNLREILEAGLK